MGNRRIWWGLGIMAAGLCAAWPFRKTLLEDEKEFHVLATPAAATSQDSRPEVPTRLAHDPAEETVPAKRQDEADEGREPLTAVLDQGVPQRKLVKLDQSAPLPRLPANFVSRFSGGASVPQSAAPVEGDFAVSPDSTPGPPRDRRYYRIRRHDTLEDIAERLLGSREHADKLLAANADVILAREILPVGATIVVPELHEPSTTMVRVPETGN